MTDIFKDVGIEVELPTEESFLKIRETLTRIGIASRKEKKLYQSCHILHKRGRYVILHFKELFILDGKVNSFSEDDLARRNTIVCLLEEWGLLKIIEGENVEPQLNIGQIKILPYREKDDWELIPKYSIGARKD